MSAGQGSCPLPWHRASFPADLFPQSQPHRAALEVRHKTVPLFDLLQRLRRLQTAHLRLPGSNQHRPQGHSRFPPHAPFPDILKITDREEVKYSKLDNTVPLSIVRCGGPSRIARPANSEPRPLVISMAANRMPIDVPVSPTPFK